MSAAVTDKFARTFNSTNPNVARVNTNRTMGATTLAGDNLAGWPTDTVVHFSTYQIDTSDQVVEGTQTDWLGIVSGNSVGSLTRLAGAADSGNTTGDIMEMGPTASWADKLIQGLIVSHNQDGTMITNLPLTTPKVTTSLKDANGATWIGQTATASAVNYVNNTNAATGTDPTLAPAGTDSNINLNLRGKGLAKTVTIGKGAAVIYAYDYVVSGCVWSGDSYGSTRAGSMTSGVVVINGNPITVAAVSAHTFTASKDTYVDVLDAGDGTGTVVYTEATNNAASAALASNSIRVGIIVTGASNIANAAAVNQGQEDRVLPIASSVPYAVTDSLGNLICPRDPNRKVLGYRQITADVTTTSTSATQATGLSCPVIIPTGRKVTIWFGDGNVFNSTAGDARINAQIWDGTVGSGTKLQGGEYRRPSSAESIPMLLHAFTTPTSSSKTYNIGFNAVTSGTASLAATSTSPVFIKVELT